MSFQARIGRLDKDINKIFQTNKGGILVPEPGRTKLNYYCSFYNTMQDNKAIILEVEQW